MAQKMRVKRPDIIELQKKKNLFGTKGAETQYSCRANAISIEDPPRTMHNKCPGERKREMTTLFRNPFSLARHFYEVKQKYEKMRDFYAIRFLLGMVHTRCLVGHSGLFCWQTSKSINSYGFLALGFSS